MVCGIAQGYAGYTVKTLRNDGYYVTRIKTSDTREKKKELAHKFVDKYIKNPTKENYLKFEQAFLRDDDFGK